MGRKEDSKELRALENSWNWAISEVLTVYHIIRWCLWWGWEVRSSDRERKNPPPWPLLIQFPADCLRVTQLGLSPPTGTQLTASVQFPSWFLLGTCLVCSLCLLSVGNASPLCWVFGTPDRWCCAIICPFSLLLAIHSIYFACHMFNKLSHFEMGSSAIVDHLQFVDYKSFAIVHNALFRC